MSVWLIEPLDPLIARDGRPAAVGRFTTTSFPSPSMVAGAVRTRMGPEIRQYGAVYDEAMAEVKMLMSRRDQLLASLPPGE